MRALGALGVSLSGCGATVFGVFDSRARATEAAEELASTRDSQATWVRVTRTLAPDGRPADA
jgi:4-diphosphocytidyl-2C-methyl-D-erythritol kinase